MRTEGVYYAGAAGYGYYTLNFKRSARDYTDDGHERVNCCHAHHHDGDLQNPGHPHNESQRTQLMKSHRVLIALDSVQKALEAFEVHNINP